MKLYSQVLRKKPLHEFHFFPHTVKGTFSLHLLFNFFTVKTVKKISCKNKIIICWFHCVTHISYSNVFSTGTKQMFGSIMLNLNTTLITFYVIDFVHYAGLPSKLGLRQIYGRNGRNGRTTDDCCNQRTKEKVNIDICICFRPVQSKHNLAFFMFF